MSMALDLNKLEAYSTEIMGKLKGISGLMDVESSVADKPTVDIVMNQQIVRPIWA